MMTSAINLFPFWVVLLGCVCVSTNALPLGCDLLTPDCKEFPDLLYPYPTSCSKYLECNQFGSPPILVGTCDYGKEFSFLSQECVSPEYSDCNSNQNDPNDYAVPQSLDEAPYYSQTNDGALKSDPVSEVLTKDSEMMQQSTNVVYLKLSKNTTLIFKNEKTLLMSGDDLAEFLDDEGQSEKDKQLKEDDDLDSLFKDLGIVVSADDDDDKIGDFGLKGEKVDEQSSRGSNFWQNDESEGNSDNNYDLQFVPIDWL